MRKVWHPHRYKYGKIDKPIDLEIFLKLLGRVAKVDRRGYPAEFIQALLALFYWTGFRKTEVLGRKPIKYKVKDDTRIGEAHPGLLREDMRVEGDALYVFSVDKNVLKHGKRVAPLVLPLSLPYVNLIVERWRKTKPGTRVFPITPICFWRICKRIDPKIHAALSAAQSRHQAGCEPQGEPGGHLRLDGLDPADSEQLHDAGWQIHQKNRTTANRREISQNKKEMGLVLFFLSVFNIDK